MCFDTDIGIILRKIDLLKLVRNGICVITFNVTNDADDVIKRDVNLHYCIIHALPVHYK